MGDVESGVRADLQRMGILSPSSALEFLAIALAAAIDTGDDSRNAAALARELRLTLAAIKASSAVSVADRLDSITASREQRLEA